MISTIVTRCLVAAAMLGATIGTAAAQDQFQMQLAHHYPKTHAQGIVYDEFAEELETRSGGRIKVTVFPAGSLISSREMYEALANGSVDAAPMVSAFQVGDLPDLQTFMLPFLFENPAHFRRTLDAGLLDMLKKEYAEHGVRLMNYSYKGRHDIMDTDKVMPTPEDFDGQNIRGLGGNLTDALSLFGANAISLPVGEVNTALQRGVIDGVQTTCESFLTRGWVDDAKYYTQIDMAEAGEGLGINAAWFDKLPKDLQDTVTDVADEMGKKMWDVTANFDENTCQARLKEKGVEVAVVAPADRAAFREKVEPLYESAASSFGNYDLVMALVEKTRK